MAHLITRQVSSQLAFWFKKFSNDFQDGGHLGFPIGMILDTFDVQVISKLPIGFETFGLLVQDKKSSK